MSAKRKTSKPKGAEPVVRKRAPAPPPPPPKEPEPAAVVAEEPVVPEPPPPPAPEPEPTEEEKRFRPFVVAIRLFADRLEKAKNDRHLIQQIVDEMRTNASHLDRTAPR